VKCVADGKEIQLKRKMEQSSEQIADLRKRIDDLVEEAARKGRDSGKSRNGRSRKNSR
jgi:hypothetical protein